MDKTKKGLTFYHLGMIVILIVSVILGYALVSGRLSDLMAFIKNLLGTEFGEYCGNNRCGPDETWDEADTSKKYCPEDCPRECFTCNPPYEAVYLGTLELTDQAGVSAGPVEVCTHSKLATAGDYFKFNIKTAGKLTVTYTPEVYTSEGFTELFCLTPQLEIYSGCGNPITEPLPKSSTECTAVQIEFDVGLPVGDPEHPLGDYYAKVSSLGEIAAASVVENKGELSVYLGDLTAICETCVGRGIGCDTGDCEWCIKEDSEKCVNDCYWGCGKGNICIDEDPSYCTPTDPLACGFHNKDLCDEDPWCHYCKACEGKKINQWGDNRCVDKDTDCSYSCSKECDPNACIDDNDCADDEGCSFETCKCESRHCCYSFGWMCIIDDYCSGAIYPETTCIDTTPCEIL